MTVLCMVERVGGRIDSRFSMTEKIQISEGMISKFQGGLARQAVL